ncbi:MAG: hypothetical protein Q7K54_01160 [Candidatus Parcubacteria bacterium]|nr:hypothetical protein [Candidatus Parcubacteria bacterium]
MFGYGYGYNGMMSGGFGSIVALLVTVNLVLLAVWLYKQINK